ncbi:MAG: PaaX family transcriptional regulator C-terminal domain-containing protein [Nocardioides sp.]|uniref:PaaX family transcriptional regulator C-terminal domain-containing protein n=1 Tax=Nocardioides sp. TaxID=35761 RepID=UPI003D6BD909
MRSAILSVLLGCYPDAIAPGRLVAAAGHFEMRESAVRAALTRGVASGDLERTEHGYRIGTRLRARHARQAEAVAPDPQPWDGSWETAFVVAAARTASDRAALRGLLTEHRLAELREGVWLRPANLSRTPAYQSHPDLTTCESRHPDPALLAGQLWDLDGWSATARRLVSELEKTKNPVSRLTVAAALVRHLRTDPILPPSLLPSDWAGDELRTVYAAYQAELRSLAELG